MEIKHHSKYCPEELKKKVRNLIERVYGENYKGLKVEQLKKQTKEGKINLWFIEDSETKKVIGMMGFEDHGKIIEIGKLMVDPKTREKGIGKLLMAKAVEELKKIKKPWFAKVRMATPQAIKLVQILKGHLLGFAPGLVKGEAFLIFSNVDAQPPKKYWKLIVTSKGLKIKEVATSKKPFLALPEELAKVLGLKAGYYTELEINKEVTLNYKEPDYQKLGKIGEIIKEYYDLLKKCSQNQRK